MAKYIARIMFEAYQDDYNEGQSMNLANSWFQMLEAPTKEELKAEIEEATYSKWADINQEDINEIDDATEYWAGYMANAENEGEASKAELEQWKKGKLDLYAIDCHILVSEVTKTKVVL